ncbi:hypothetical protein AAFM46_13455 [Arthrobacter sp. TMP15]|uniref:hypothetical protein n=1 Tax=Arthrobacter sp. TMP15 TaxID=3140789 RepID=UPI0031BB03AD
MALFQSVRDDDQQTGTSMSPKDKPQRSWCLEARKVSIGVELGASAGTFTYS